jgi:2-hydroxy-4-(methylsulfanyl)butanoate S-methyltransferase
MSWESARTDLRTIRDQIAVLGLAEGFLQSRVLFTLMKLRIFELIGEGVVPLDDLAASTGAKPATLARLLNAGVVLKLLAIEDGSRYRLTPVSLSVLLPSAGDGYLGNWIRNLSYFDVALSKLDEAVLLSGPTVDPSTHFGSDREVTKEFSLAMHNYATLRGRELAHYLDTTMCRSMLDVGCGHGAYSFHLGLANPALKLYLMDSAGVLEVAKETQKGYALRNEIQYLPGDALKDEFEGRYDLILISNALHALGAEASRALIQRLYSAVNPGGSLVIQAQFLRDDRLGERWPIMLDLIQLCVTSAGSNHTVQETRGWLEAAGFSDIEHRSMSIFNTNTFLRGYKR